MPEENDIIEIQKGALYPLLAKCTNHDLDPLVKIITSRRLNGLVSKKDYTLNNPNHTMYYKAIGDEICSYGGHSLANIFRGSKGPDYSEIVEDVCNILMVHGVSKDIIQNEKKLIDLYFEDEWGLISDSNREENIAKARNKVSKIISSKRQKIKTSITNLAPLALVSMGLNQNYEITAPCVIHIAYLRQKITSELRKASTILLPAPNEMKHSVQSDQLVITSESGESLLEISRIEEPVTKTEWSDVDDNISTLNPLLQIAPELLISLDVATTQYVRVQCNGALASAKGVAGAMRGHVLGKKGIESHALLYSADKLTSLVNVSAVMNIASFVLAQKHLSDINNKLKEITKSIENIANFQNNRRRSKLTGSINFFEQIAPSILEGDLADSFLTVIHQQDLTITTIQHHIINDIKEELKKLKNLKDEQWFSSKKIISEIEKNLNLSHELYRDLLLCIQARAFGLQLLSAYPGNEKIKEQRFMDIKKAFEEIDENGDFIKKMIKLYRKKIYDVSPTLVFGSDVNKRKIMLSEDAKKTFMEINAWRVNIKKELEFVDKNIKSLKNKTIFFARVEDGKITGVKAL